MLAVHFGAGSVGRGLVGQVLNEAGYKVCFVDLDSHIVVELNRQGKYSIVLAGESKTTVEVSNVMAMDAQLDAKGVIDAIGKAAIVTTAVGTNALPTVAKLIADALNLRLSVNKTPLNIFACENAMDASQALKQLVSKHILTEVVGTFDDCVGFVNSTVDRIVSQQIHEDFLTVTVDPHCEWISDSTQVVGGLPDIAGIRFVSDFMLHAERKFFTVDTMYTAVAFAGANFGHATVLQALKDKNIQDLLKGVCNETGEYLINKYNLDREEHAKYQQRTLERISNALIVDHVNRVARNPISKLGANERFVKPALQLLDMEIEVGADTLNSADLQASPELVAALAQQFGVDASTLQDEGAIKQALNSLLSDYSAVLAPASLSKVIAMVLLYRDSDDEESVQLQQYLSTIGVEEFLQKYCGIDEDSTLMQLIVGEYLKLFKSKKTK